MVLQNIGFVNKVSILTLAEPTVVTAVSTYHHQWVRILYLIEFVRINAKKIKCKKKKKKLSGNCCVMLRPGVFNASQRNGLPRYLDVT